MNTIEHINKSCQRTGKWYGEMHYWMDERVDKAGKQTGGRFTDTHTKEGLAYIEEKWGKEALEEARQHIKDDGLE